MTRVTRHRFPHFDMEEPSGWRRVFLRMGHRRGVVAITMISVVLSVSVTLLVSVLFDNVTYLAVDLVIATIVPLIVAPLVSYYAVGLLFEVEQARKQLHHAATRDSLTQLYNRGFFLARLETEIERARRDGKPPALILIDVDDFKTINDAFGHAEGDAVLVRLAELLNAAVRPYDVVARYGGEEFVVLMPAAGLMQAETAAERIRVRLEATSLYRDMVSDDHGPVTASIGVTCLGGPEDCADDILARADRAMYVAKSGGRNRCVTQPPPKS